MRLEPAAADVYDDEEGDYDYGDDYFCDTNAKTPSPQSQHSAQDEVFREASDEEAAELSESSRDCGQGSVYSSYRPA
jgi:hypothetical protein